MSRAPTRLPHGDGGRTNEDWLAGLRCNDSFGLKAQAELRGYIRRGLGRIFGKQGDLDDASLEDLTQESMIRITTRLDDFRGESKPVDVSVVPPACAEKSELSILSSNKLKSPPCFAI